MAWWEVLTQTSAYPQFLAAAGMIALAAFLLHIDFNHVAHRAFALLLGFRAIAMLAATLRGLYAFSPPPELGGIGDVNAAILWGNLAPYFVIPVPFLVVWFASVYPRRRGWFGASRGGGWLLLGVALAFEIAYALNHALFVSHEQITLSAAGIGTWSTIAIRSEGPLAPFSALMLLSLAILSAVFARDYVRLPIGPRKSGLFIVTIAFIMNALWDGTQNGLALVADVDSAAARTNLILIAAGLLPALAALSLLVGHLRHVPAAERHRIRLALLFSPLPVLTAAFAIFNPLDRLAFIQLILTGLWRLWLPALVTYALVRHQLFDIDLKIKFAVKQSTMAGLAFVGFVVLSETLEAIITSSSVLTQNIPQRWSDMASLTVAVGLTYALNPVKVLAGNVANRVMPGTTGTQEYLTRKRIEVFRATLEGAVEDGAMTDRERILVEKLRTQLGLSTADVQPILADVEAAYAGRTIGRTAPAATP